MSASGDPNGMGKVAAGGSYGLVELHELGLRPGVLLDEGPLHGLSKVLLEVVREDPLGLAELRSREGQTRVLVLPQVLELL